MLVLTRLPSSGHNLGDSMSYSCPRLLRLLPREPTRNTHLERGLRLPACISRVNSKTEGKRFDTCNKNAVGETLHQISLVRVRSEENQNGELYLVHYISEQLVLVVYAEFLCLDNLGLEDEKEHWIVNCAGRSHPIAPWV
jgi:hypothetical protein